MKVGKKFGYGNGEGWGWGPSVLLAAALSLPVDAFAQNTEEQRIIDVITGEIDAWYNKDRAGWVGAIVHSRDFAMTSASQNGYYRVHGFDSLVASREQHFTTPPDNNVKRIAKSDFHVNIKGSVAIVDLTVSGDDFAGDQMIIMEKQGKPGVF